jgi:O-antigen/teichoic acid export membrane protein
LKSGQYRSVAGPLIRGSAWMVAMRWAIRLIGVLSVAVLARILTPADFGVVAMALVVVGLLDTLAYAGVDLAIIRSSSASPEYLNAAWTIQLIQASIVAGLLLVLAPFAADYYSEARVATVIRWLALRAFIEGFQNIGIVAFQKDLDFAKEFRFHVYSRLLNLIFAIVAALILRNYLALVVGMLSGAAITVLLSYLMHPYRPRLSIEKLKALRSFSNWLLVSRLGTFLSGGADQFIAGGIVGATAIGSYNVASQLATMPSGELVMPLRRALFPNLSKLQDDPVEFRRLVQQTFSSLAIVCIPLSFGLVMTADEIIRIILGPRWYSSVDLLKWLAVYGAFAGLVSILEVPMWVMGRLRQSALQSWLGFVVLVPLIVISVHEYGIVGAAVSRALVAILSLPLMLYLTSRACPVRYQDLASVLWRPLLAGILMMVALAAPWSYPTTIVLAFAMKVALGAVVYIGALIAIWRISGRPDGIEATVLKYVAASRRPAS